MDYKKVCDVIDAKNGVISSKNGGMYNNGGRHISTLWKKKKQEHKNTSPMWSQNAAGKRKMYFFLLMGRVFRVGER